MTKTNEIAKLRADLADARRKIVDCITVIDELCARIVAHETGEGLDPLGDLLKSLDIKATAQPDGSIKFERDLHDDTGDSMPDNEQA